jgi:hypothetical protein
LADCGGFTANIEAEALAVEKASGSLACNCSPIISDCSPIENILSQIRAANSTQEKKITISKVEGKSSLSNDTDWVSALNGIEIDGKCFKLNLQFQFAANTIELNPSKYKETDNGYSLINEKGEVLISISIINGLEKKKFLKEYLGFVVKNLRDLIKKGEISANEIKEYREYIKTLPVAQRAAWYLELQKHVPYHSQSDNQCEAKGANGHNMCSVTSLAMNFEALGVSNPDSDKQFEDYLGEEEGYPDFKLVEAWSRLANDYYLKTSSNIPLNNSKATLISKIKPELEKGNSISLSLYPSCKGHIVRVQGIDNGGLWIDDPYGSCPIKCKLYRQKCGKNSYQKYGSTPDGGNNNYYTWDEIKQITVKYMVVFSTQ